jgi:hypothetical protein
MRSTVATQHRPGLGPAHERYIAAQHARKLSSRALPRRSPSCQFFLVHFQVQSPFGNVDADDVPVADQPNGTAVERLGRHVADAGAAAGSAEAAIGDQSHTVIEPRPRQSRRGAQHLGHAGSALRTYVANDDHGATLHHVGLDSRHQRGFIVEDLGGTPMDQHLRLDRRLLDHRPRGSQVAEENGEPARRLVGTV